MSDPPRNLAKAVAPVALVGSGMALALTAQQVMPELRDKALAFGTSLFDCFKSKFITNDTKIKMAMAEDAEGESPVSIASDRMKLLLDGLPPP